MEVPAKDMTRAMSGAHFLNELTNLINKYTTKISIMETLGLLQLEITYIATRQALQGTDLRQLIQGQQIDPNAIAALLNRRKAE